MKNPDFHNSKRRKQNVVAFTSDRLPPHSIESEQALLGCLLLDPVATLDVVTSRTDSRCFYDLRHQTIFDALIKLRETGRPIDMVTLVDLLKSNGQLEAVGGVQYIATLPDTPPSAINLPVYLDLVLEKWMLRQSIQICSEYISNVYEVPEHPENLIDALEQDVLKIRANRDVGGMVASKELVHRSMEVIEDMYENRGSISGIPTGFVDFDKMTGGLEPGQMIVVAARPSVGKTSWAMNVVDHVAVECKLPVGVFSLEMNSENLITRMISSRARVNIRNIRDGFMSDRDFPRLTSSAGKIHAAPIFIDDTSSMSIMQLRARARRAWQQHGIKLFVVDYLQLLTSQDGKGRRQEHREREISEISAGIKALAKELKVPIMVLSQLNRSVDKDKNRAPRLSDIRESGSIEQDADMVAFLYRPVDEEEGEGNPESDCHSVNLLIGKQRSGPTGSVYLTFLKQFTRFESSAKVASEDVELDEYAKGKDKGVRQTTNDP